MLVHLSEYKMNLQIRQPHLTLHNYSIFMNIPEQNIQGVSRLVDITAGGDFLGLCDQKTSYKHVSDFGRLRGYDRLKLRNEGSDY
jgi:hypothetical protein